ncbi:MAG: hypothetical protein WC264_03500 [Candidatus Paceibacterota bacterium]|jgi:hypothetical protein
MKTKMFLTIIVNLFTIITMAQTVEDTTVVGGTSTYLTGSYNSTKKVETYMDSLGNAEVEKYNQKNKQVFDDFKEFVKEKGVYLGKNLYVINNAKYYIIVWPRKTISITVREDEKTFEIYICAIDCNGDGLNVYSGDELFYNRDGLFSPLDKANMYKNELKTIMHSEKWKLY